MAFNQWLKAVNAAIKNSNGPMLAKLLALNNAEAMQGAYEVQAQPQWNAEAVCARMLPNSRPPWSPVVAKHCQALLASSQGDRQQAYGDAAAALAAFSTDFRDDSRDWTAPVMQQLILNCKALAQAADAAAASKGQEAKCSSNLIEEVRKCYRNTPNAANDERRSIQLFLINMQLKLYFLTNNLHLCKTLARTVDQPNFSALLHSFPMSQQVTLMYYRGRLHIFNEEYVRVDAVYCR